MLEVATKTVRGDPMLPRTFHLKRIRRENEDTFTLELLPADGRENLTFRPGQFNMIYQFGVGEIPISVSGNPTRSGPLLHTIRAVGAVTRGLCALKRGQMVGVRGPFGSAWPVEEARGHDLVVVAGGIGLAPVRPVIYHVLAHRKHYGRVLLLYGARSPHDILYRDELEKWRGRFDLDVLVTVDHGTSSWYGHVGVVPNLIRRVAFDPDHTVAMTCGPEIMMRYTARALMDRGVREEKIYISMERNMKCAVGLCGHCQLGPAFICKDGAVFPLPHMTPYWETREL